jgi:hypothetical protein
MSQNFLACDREQVFLMPPDPRDWLPEGHLAWFVLASVFTEVLSLCEEAGLVKGIELALPKGQRVTLSAVA